MLTLELVLLVIVVAFCQNISFTMVSRARNRDKKWYHAICAVGSNGIWFATMHYLVVSDFNFWLAMPYIFGTVSGSLVGADISMKIEKAIGAKT